MVLIASILSNEATLAVAVFTIPIVVRVAVPLIAVCSAGVDMLIVAVIAKPTIAGVAIRHLEIGVSSYLASK